jgi:WD40 repeat protein/predicted Zn-dependent protease
MVLHQVLHEEPKPPRTFNDRIPRDLQTICLKAMAKEPTRRFASAGALAEDLRRFLNGLAIHARPVGRVEKTWRWARRNPGLAITTALTAGALVAVTILSLHVAAQQSHFAAQQAHSNNELVQEQQLTRAQKKRAEDALQKSDELAGRLAGLLKESQKHTARLALERGLSLVERHQPYQGLLWLGRGLEQAPAEEGDLRSALRLSMASVRREMPVLRTVLPSGDLVYAVAFSPDGKLILTGGGTVDGPHRAGQLWDTVTGQPVGPPLAHKSTVYEVAFSPDGQTVATASIDKTARLWRTATGEPLSPPLEHPGPVTAVAFSPDGKTLLTGCFGQTQTTGQAQLWNVATGKSLGSPVALAGPVGHMKFSSDGKTFATTILDYQAYKGEVQFWQTATRQRVGQPLAHPGMVFSLAFSPDGKTLVTGCMDRQVRFWDTATGNPVKQVLDHQGYVYAVGYSPDGRTVLSGGDGAVRFWDAETGQPVGTPLPQQGFLLSLAISPDGQSLVVPSIEQNVCVWQLPTGRLLHAPLPHPEHVSSLALSPDGKMFVTATGRMDLSPRPCEAQRWDTATALPIGPPLRHKGSVCVAISPDGKLILTGSMDNTARLWDAATGKPLGPPLVHPTLVLAVAFSPDGKTFLTATGNPNARAGAVRLWDTATCVGASLAPTQSLFQQREGEAPAEPGDRANPARQEPRPPAIRPSGSDSQQTRPMPRQLLSASSFVFAAAFSPDGKTVCAGSGNFMSGLVQFWDVASGKSLPLTLKHQNNVRAVAFSPDGKTVATASQDRTVQLWDFATGKRLIPALQHQASVDAVQFSPDGKLLLTCSEDKTARLWSATTGQPLGLPLQHPAGVLAGAFSPDGKIVLTGGEDRTARLWDVAPAEGSVEELHTRFEVLTGIQLSNDGLVQNLDAATWQKRREKLPGVRETFLPSQGLSWHQHEALRHLQTGHSSAALWHLDRQLQMHPEDGLARVLRGKVYVEQQQLDRAAADWDKALKVGPRERIVRWFSMYQADCVEKEQWPTALWYLARLTAAHPEDPALWLRGASIHERLKQWQEAADAYGQALKLQTDDPQLWRQQAQCYLKLEQWDRAAAAYAGLLALLPATSNQFAERSQLCQELAGREALYAKLVELRPKDWLLRIDRARYHARRSQWQLAAAEYARAPEDRPVNEDAFEQACAYLLTGDAKGYEQLCRRLIAHVGQDPEPFTAFVLARTCGLAPHGSDAPLRAVQWGQRAVASDRNAWYLHALGMAHLRAGQFEEALQRFQQSAASNWNNGPALIALSLALGHHHLGHVDESRSWLGKAEDRIKSFTPETLQGVTSLPATDWLEMHVLRQEAERLVRKK